MQIIFCDKLCEVYDPKMTQHHTIKECNLS